MSNYLRNVAHRAAGASLLRPKIPSRFEPVAGMGPGVVSPVMNHFREMVTEREAEAPRATKAMETRVSVSPAPARAAEPQVRREEVQPAIRHTAEDRVVLPKKAEIDQPHPLQQTHTQNDSVPNTSMRARSLHPEITQETVDARVSVSRKVTGETVQPLPEPARRTSQALPAEMPVAPQFPALAAERREAIDKPALLQPVPRADSPVRNREIPATPSPAAHMHFAPPQVEIATRDVHVTIGKVTVQATLPATPVHAPARVPGHTGPRLTLERYLDRRGGRP